MVISTPCSPSPVTRPAHSPSIVDRPSSSRPSSRKKSIVPPRSSTTIPTLSIRFSAIVPVSKASPRASGRFFESPSPSHSLSEHDLSLSEHDLSEPVSWTAAAAAIALAARREVPPSLLRNEGRRLFDGPAAGRDMTGGLARPAAGGENSARSVPDGHEQLGLAALIRDGWPADVLLQLLGQGIHPAGRFAGAMGLGQGCSEAGDSADQ